MKNKLVTIMVIILVSITLVGVLAVVVITKFNGNGEKKDPSIEEIVKSSVDIPEITTNLGSGDFIKMSFTIQTDSTSAKKELEQRTFQVKNIIITELSDMKPEALKGKAGKIKFEEQLKTKVNALMKEGHIVQVYITSSILQ